LKNHPKVTLENTEFHRRQFDKKKYQYALTSTFHLGNYSYSQQSKLDFHLQVSSYSK